MTAKQINAWFKEWIEEKRFLMNNDEPIRLYDLAEFFAFCEKKSEETEMVICADNKIVAEMCKEHEGATWNEKKY